MNGDDQDPELLQPGLEGRVVLVSGAGSGIGAAVSTLLARSGARVLATDVDREGGERLVERITDDGATARFEPLDVVDAEAWRRVVDLAVDEWGSVDGLVNNAGIGSTARIADLGLAELSHLFEVNSVGALNGIATVAPMMGHGGSIVNVASIAGIGAWPSAGYAMSKWAVTGLTKVAALELGPRGIRVNAVHPGIVETPMTAGIAPEVETRYVASTALGRLGHPRDVASTIAFMCSPAAAYITGADLVVDGGFTAVGSSLGVYRSR